MSLRPSISSFALKVAAIAGMTCNHVANVFAFALPGWATALLCTFGGLTFPVMAFLLCEGYRHTSNVGRYAMRLAAFAVVAQVPYSLLWGATANVLVTLLMGLGLLWADEHLRNRGLFALIVVAGVAASWFCDWGVIGPVMVLLFWKLRERPRGVALVMLVSLLAFGLPALSLVADEYAAAETPGASPAVEQLFGTTAPSATAVEELAVESPNAVSKGLEVAGQTTAHPTFTVTDGAPLAAALGTLGYATVGFGLAALLMLKYNGRRGRPLKWFFYLYYPAHLLVLWGLAQLL
ncbi:TraX family protein [uncultured Adlercreutzia sp.]|uniref:TraX family protein n=1 Tax=uncultured Adlercreutzia sp. TaxID=875803 RepID=UPI0025F8BAE6|nr:TraX family protein [uncultured Adlercreutzia sp.]